MPRGIPNKTLIEQFMAKVSKDGPIVREEIGKCWSYIGGTDQNGYGKFRKERWGTSYAHVWSYTHHHGPITDKQVVRHKCDNPSCVNPDHLEIGTHKDNAIDRITRKPMTCKRKITDDDVVTITVMREAGETVPAIAEAFGVHAGTIQNLCSGKVFYAEAIPVVPRYMRRAAEVLKLHADGLSMAKISKQLNMCHSTVSRVINEAIISHI